LGPVDQLNKSRHELSCPVAARNFRLHSRIPLPSFSKYTMSDEAIPKDPWKFSHWPFREAVEPFGLIGLPLIGPWIDDAWENAGGVAFSTLPPWREIKFHSELQRGQAGNACYI
jgi:hypothetical protein